MKARTSALRCSAGTAEALARRSARNPAVGSAMFLGGRVQLPAFMRFRVGCWFFKKSFSGRLGEGGSNLILPRSETWVSLDPLPARRSETVTGNM